MKESYQIWCHFRVPRLLNHASIPCPWKLSIRVLSPLFIDLDAHLNSFRLLSNCSGTSIAFDGIADHPLCEFVHRNDGFLAILV